MTAELSTDPSLKSRSSEKLLSTDPPFSARLDSQQIPIWGKDFNSLFFALVAALKLAGAGRVLSTDPSMRDGFQPRGRLLAFCASPPLNRWISTEPTLSNRRCLVHPPNRGKDFNGRDSTRAELGRLSTDPSMREGFQPVRQRASSQDPAALNRSHYVGRIPLCGMDFNSPHVLTFPTSLLSRPIPDRCPQFVGQDQISHTDQARSCQVSIARLHTSQQRWSRVGAPAVA